MPKGATQPVFARQNAIDESCPETNPIDLEGAIIQELNADVIWTNNKPPKLIRRPVRASGRVSVARSVAGTFDVGAENDSEAAAAPQPKRCRASAKPT
jgi:hypothetical protein